MAKEIVICDTDVIIDYWNGNSQRHRYTKRIIEGLVERYDVSLSAITKMELIIGAVNKDELRRIDKGIHEFDIVLVNDDISRVAVELLQKYNLSHGLALPDAFIAATSIVLNANLFTFNIKDYRFISALKLFQAVDQQ